MMLSPGFAEPVDDAQVTFRAVLQAMARPGTVAELAVCPLAPAPLSPAMAAVALMLADHETPIWLGASLDVAEVRNFLTFHTGAPIVDVAAKARFVLVADDGELPDPDQINIGTPDYPDRSATLLIGAEAFDDGAAVRLSGPGIRGESEFRARGFDLTFWRRAQDNHELYPLGVDVVLCAGTQIAALPRSTRIVLGDERTET